MSLMKAIRELLFGKKCTCGGHCHVDAGPDGEELEEADGPGDVDINAYAGESTEDDEAED